MATISEALAIALQHHRAGRLQAAQQVCRQMVAIQPRDADAIHLLGVIAWQMRKRDEALAYWRRRWN